MLRFMVFTGLCLLLIGAYLAVLAIGAIMGGAHG